MSKTKIGALCIIPILITIALCVIRPRMITLTRYDDEGTPSHHIIPKKLLGWTVVLALIFCGAAFGIMRYVGPK